ncbi:hypothetical protein ACGC1H_006216 [Rhizoctonia solani]
MADARYEYGYLCFCVLTIVLGICILDRSTLLDPSIQAMPVDHRIHPQLEVFNTLTNHFIPGGSADYLPRIKHFYGQLCVSMPKHYIHVMSDHCLPEWLKFRSYLTWYPEIRRLIHKDRDHIKKCLGIWNDIGKSLGYQVHEKSRSTWDGWRPVHLPHLSQWSIL